MAMNRALKPTTSRNGGVNIEAWTEEAISTLSTGRISAVTITEAHSVRGTSVTLDIPLDADATAPSPKTLRSGLPLKTRDDALRTSAGGGIRPSERPRSELSRRDSLKRREAILKGKEGSRRRQRWENDRLLGNPWAEPPEPADWEPRATHPVHAVPYFLAPLWDDRKAQAEMARADKARQAKQNTDPDRAARNRVPRDLRERLKRSKAAKGLLQDLEERVRAFVTAWEAKQKALPIREKEDGWADGAADAPLSSEEEDEEEIVFVGRNGSMKNMRIPRRQSVPKRTAPHALVFDGPADDNGASFGRWLVHSIAAYYDLQTWSVTTSDDPARREAYVGLKDSAFRERQLQAIDASADAQSVATSQLPRPLWVLV